MIRQNGPILPTMDTFPNKYGNPLFAHLCTKCSAVSHFGDIIDINNFIHCSEPFTSINIYWRAARCDCWVLIISHKNQHRTTNSLVENRVRVTCAIAINISAYFVFIAEYLSINPISMLDSCTASDIWSRQSKYNNRSVQPSTFGWIFRGRPHAKRESTIQLGNR